MPSNTRLLLAAAFILSFAGLPALAIAEDSSELAITMNASETGVNFASISWLPLPPDMSLETAQAPAGPWSRFLNFPGLDVVTFTPDATSRFFRIGTSVIEEEGQKGSDRAAVTPRHLAVFLIDFPDTSADVKASEFPTPEEAHELLFGGNVKRYFDDMSGETFSMSGDVFGYFTHQDPGLDNGVFSEMGQVLSIDSIVVRGFDINEYDGVVIMSVHDAYLAGARGASGKALRFKVNGRDIAAAGVFCPYRTDWANLPINYIIPTGPDDSTEGPSTVALSNFERTFAHEIIHYLGIPRHANSKSNGEFYDYEPEVPGNYQMGDRFPFLDWEYGNYFDVLGTSFYGASLNGVFRDFLGWANDGNRTSIKGYGRYTVQIHPINGSVGTRFVEIRIPYLYYEFADSTNDKNQGYFLEVRNGDNEWDSMLMHPELQENNNGIMVLKTNGVDSQLLDMSPTPNFPFYGQRIPDNRDVVLKPGMSYEKDDIKLSNVSKSPDGSFLVDIEVKRP